MSKNSEYIETQTSIDPTWTVIWLHGLGADGHDFEPIVPELGFTDSPGIRFIFPHAPHRPITINGGMSMRGWYDIKGMIFDREEDSQGLEDSAIIVNNLIAQENQRGISTDHIILTGFSQGGAIALFTGLRHQQPLGGIIALSTYLPVAETTESERTDSNLNTPIFMAHGAQDPVIPISLAEQSKKKLNDLDYQVEWHDYPMPHSVCPEELGHIAKFIHNIVQK